MSGNNDHQQKTLITIFASQMTSNHPHPPTPHPSLLPIASPPHLTTSSFPITLPFSFPSLFHPLSVPGRTLCFVGKHASFFAVHTLGTFALLFWTRFYCFLLFISFVGWFLHFFLLSFSVFLLRLLVPLSPLSYIASTISCKKKKNIQKKMYTFLPAFE